MCEGECVEVGVGVCDKMCDGVYIYCPQSRFSDIVLFISYIYLLNVIMEYYSYF